MAAKQPTKRDDAIAADAAGAETQTAEKATPGPAGRAVARATPEPIVVEPGSMKGPSAPAVVGFQYDPDTARERPPAPPAVAPLPKRAGDDSDAA